MSEKFIIAYDIGTTLLKTAILNEKLEVLAKETMGYPIHVPQKGYAEQDPLDWWKAIVETTHRAMEDANITKEKISGIIFSAMMSTLIPINKDGEPLTKALTWLDTRAAPQAEKLVSKGILKVSGYNLFSLWKFLRITGGAPGLAGKDNISRIIWFKEEAPDIYRDTYKFLDAKDYLIYKTTGETVTSRDLAHLWWLMDTRPKVMDWSKALLKKYKIDREKLPEIKLSIDIAGKLKRKAARELGLKEGTPVIVGAGDITTVAVGSGAVRENEFHVYIGTSDWVAAHSKERKLDIFHYIGPLNSAIPDRYLIIAEQETAGACLDWVKENMFKEEMDQMGEKVYDLFDEIVSKIPPGAEGLIFTPWLAGERAPLDDETVRGGFHNLSIEHNREHMVRAVMEGVAFNMYWVLEYMEKLLKPVNWVNFVGGGALRKQWNQILADMFGKEIRKVEMPREVGVRGATIIALVALKHFESFEQASSIIKIEKVYKPNLEVTKFYKGIFKEFKEIYNKNKDMYRRMNQ
ncbi:MAG: xylulokinase [Candidatus Njordarchaeia archaeon]